MKFRQLKKIITIICISLFLNIYILAQSDYRPGFIITNNNDTVYGLIDYSGETVNFKSCKFKYKDADIPVKYLPFDIISYRFLDDKFYISKEIYLNGEKEKRFLEFLLHGIVDLYYYQDVNGEFFYIQKEDTLIELKNTKVKTYINGVEYYKKDKKYIGILKYLFIDAPEIQNKIDNLSLDRKSLIKITEDYNQKVCNDDSKCVIYKKKLPPTIINIGPLIGYHTLFIDPQTLSWKIYRNQTIIDCNYDRSTSMTYGLYANVFLPNSGRRLVLQYEGIIYSYKLSSTYQNIGTGLDGPNIDGTYKYSISSTDLSHNFSLRYNILNLKFRPFIQIGGNISQKLKLKKTGLENVYFIGSRSFSRQIYYGFCLGMGVAYQYKENKEIFLKIIFKRGIGPFFYFKAKDVNLTLGIPIFNFK
jgi:hypothetical protein